MTTDPKDLTVLIVEDDQRLAQLTREYLEGNGLRVAVEADGARAAARILAEQPDLVILDLMLPGEDGLSICKRLRKTGTKTPVIMLTALDQDLDKLQALRVGADDYVVKPFSPKEDGSISCNATS